jgi:pimeloyl-ACP methyl ester carboxylesterase
LQRRIDEGAISGNLKERYDPESILGENELFVYYAEQASTSRIRRCKTGIALTNSGSGYTLTSGIQYDNISGVNPNLFSLDVYEPNSPPGLKPVMVYIHGGSWNAGDKAWYVSDMAKLFTDSGYVFVSINYRLSPNPPDTLSPTVVRFPVHPRDCAKAFQWVVNNIHQYSGDTSRISLMGHSAGAHLTLLLSTNQSFLSQFSISPQKVKCACSLDAGVFDVEEELQQAGSFIPRREPLINAFGNNTSLYDDASPQYHIQAGKYLPRLHLVHQNTSDRLYSHYRFRNSLIGNGHTNFSLFNAAPYDHSSIALMIGNVNDSVNVTGSVMQFFGNCLNSITTGIIDIENDFEEIRIFPNPTNTILFIKTESNNSLQYQISNSIGQTIQQGNLNGNNIDVSWIPRGIYFIQFKDKKGHLFTSKFIKQ